MIRIPEKEVSKILKAMKNESVEILIKGTIEVKQIIDKLEYNKILEMLEGFAKTYLGKNLCRRLNPSTNVSFLLEQTNQALGLIYKKGSLPLSSIPNIDIAIKNLESNFSLTASDLLEIGSILKASRELKEYFLDETCDLILPSCDLLYINKLLEKEIFDKILDENTISDNASSKLNSIRKSQKNLGVEIKNKLNSMVHSATYSKYLQDSIVTIKNERYVIPVKEEYRSFVKGFVHDVSSSGSTVFIEPLAVFELNNELNNLKAEEAIEIAKILTELSRKLMPITNELKNNVELIGQIDFIFAKASFSKKLNGIKPDINNKKYVNLIQARHPLIDESKVVPIDIYIGENYSSLIITGPNTGGKTVCLKTTGLLLLMAYSGILIPCKENSSIYVFDNIFADIGDEQSISESLSTFSSHILNIVENMKLDCINKVISDFCVTWYASKDDVMYAALHYRNGEIPNESVIKATIDYQSYKDVHEKALPKFRYYTQCMAELRKTLDEEIKPLLTIAG